MAVQLCVGLNIIYSPITISTWKT